ncbi:hypothetical protein ALI22I_05940 [Saccharothrix sp. ALI-22-I]|uniref:hypothetical protein n=1 Tax=Saccharothrix sp. ALI-22-I TaxID=1933778 RepID=UPI00097BCFF6|nr:hypothetical protein ALI22I_05940 [Saccharothrix sp. ALI-22-I]
MVKVPMVAVPEAGTLHDEVGTWKAVVDADTGQILGAALLGCNAGGVISALHMAMLGGLCCQQFRGAVLTHSHRGWRTQPATTLSAAPFGGARRPS